MPKPQRTDKPQTSTSPGTPGVSSVAGAEDESTAPIHGALLTGLDPLPKETPPAYAAFLKYALAGGTSYKVLAEATGRTEATIRYWASKYEWQRRLKDLGAGAGQLVAQALPPPDLTEVRDWTERRKQLREREWEMHESLLNAARSALERLQHTRETVSFADILRALDLASKLGRLAAGMATTKTEMSGDANAPIRIEFEAALKKVYGDPGPAGVIDVESIPVQIHQPDTKH